MKKVAWKTEIVRIVLRRYCDYVLPNMYKNILKCWSENHSCTWSKGLFKTVYEKKSWTWPILELWGWYKTLGRAGLSYKGEEGSVWTSTFPHLLFTLFSIWLKHTLWNSVWEESTGRSFQRYRLNLLLCYLSFTWAWTSHFAKPQFSHSQDKDNNINHRREWRRWNRMYVKVLWNN